MTLALKKSRRPIASVSILLMTLLALVACGGASSSSTGSNQPASADWKATLSQACSEGTVTWYVSFPLGDIQGIADGFSKAYPCIKLQFTRIPSGIVAKVEQERVSGSPGADLISFDIYPYLESLVSQGLLVTPAGPNFAKWPSDYVRSKTYVALAFESFTIAYNKELVSTPPTSYSSLLDPSLSGKIATTQVLNAATVTAFYEYLMAHYGADYLSKLAANKPRLFAGSAPVVQAVASGDASYALYNSPAADAALIKAGAPLAIVRSNPAPGIAWYAGILKWGKHQAAAQVLMDYLLSPDVAAVFVQNGLGFDGVPLKVKGSLDPATIVPLDENVSQAQIDAFTQLFNGLFVNK